MNYWGGTERWSISGGILYTCGASQGILYTCGASQGVLKDETVSGGSKLCTCGASQGVLKCDMFLVEKYV